MVVIFNINLGYILQSVKYITYSYGFMLYITFGYSCIVLYMQYNFDVMQFLKLYDIVLMLCYVILVLYYMVFVLCYMIYYIICCIVLYIVLYYMLYNVICCIWFLKNVAAEKIVTKTNIFIYPHWVYCVSCLICTSCLIQQAYQYIYYNGI